MRTKPTKQNISTEFLALYDKVLATKKVERKGATMPYTSLNGNMYSFLTPAGMVIRLSNDDREAFIKKYKTKLYEAYGSAMREYAIVPAPLLKKTAELKKHFAMSHAYAASLKPKPTKKKNSR